MNAALSNIVSLLCDFSSPNIFNPWRDVDPMDHSGYMGPTQRIERLLAHFDCKPDFLLIGEAPGYRGCHFSGVPFTSEKLILSGSIPRVSCSHRISTRPSPWTEPSSTVLWSELYRLGIAERVVCFNAFAWHPHEPGEPYSNRTPTTAEQNAGALVLHAVIDYFKGAKVIAVGQVARDAIWPICPTAYATVRHPSMGGASQFREQMRLLGIERAA